MINLEPTSTRKRIDEGSLIKKSSNFFKFRKYILMINLGFKIEQLSNAKQYLQSWYLINIFNNQFSYSSSLFFAIFWYADIGELYILHMSVDATRWLVS